MKTSVVPAQITTVEDKIAGNMTFSQIVLLVIPLILGTVVYVTCPPLSKLSIFKFVVITVLFACFGLLAIRIKGRTVADWLVILLRFGLRPHLYLFTKNDLESRNVIASEKPKEAAAAVKQSAKKKQVKHKAVGPNQSALNRLLREPNLTVNLELGKKGGINVSVSANKD
jgi:hypothetical protein